jgi:hypothetical protein
MKNPPLNNPEPNESDRGSRIVSDANPYSTEKSHGAAELAKAAGSKPVGKANWGLRLIGIFFALAITSVAAIIAIPQIERHRYFSRRNTCQTNLQKIGTALADYERKHGSLPPAYTTATDGTRLHSWRVLILPFLNQADLYSQFDLTKPWDHPHNLAVAKRNPMPSCYRCPSSKGNRISTTYAAIVDENSSIQSDRGRFLEEITDDHSQTILIVELGTKANLSWTEPRDLNCDDFIELIREPESIHIFDKQVLMLDLRVQELNEDTPEEKLRAYTTVAASDETSEYFQKYHP